MPMTNISHRPNIRMLWPWMIGAFLLGTIVMAYMPPLPPIAFVALSVWVLARRDHQTDSSRKVLAVAVGLLLATALYQIVWFAGNISR
jgi:ABC-type enterobactin transport system permease subunit